MINMKTKKNKNDTSEVVMVSEEYSDRFDLNSIVSNPTAYTEEEEASYDHSLSYDDKLYYSVDGNNRILACSYIDFSKITTESVAKITLSVKPSFVDQRELPLLIKTLVFSDKNIMVHNLCMNGTYMFDGDETNLATANFEWHIQNIEYKDGILIFSLFKHI